MCGQILQQTEKSQKKDKRDPVRYDKKYSSNRTRKKTQRTDTESQSKEVIKGGKTSFRCLSDVMDGRGVHAVEFLALIGLLASVHRAAEQAEEFERRRRRKEMFLVSAALAAAGRAAARSRGDKPGIFFSGGFAFLRKFGLIGGYRSDGGRRSARGEAAERA